MLELCTRAGASKTIEQKLHTALRKGRIAQTKVLVPLIVVVVADYDARLREVLALSPDGGTALVVRLKTLAAQTQPDGAAACGGRRRGPRRARSWAPRPAVHRVRPAHCCVGLARTLQEGLRGGRHARNPGAGCAPRRGEEGAPDRDKGLSQVRRRLFTGTGHVLDHHDGCHA